MVFILQKEGLFTSLQSCEAGRRQSFGINPCGPMDPFAAKVANLMAGNPEDSNVLELHFPGPEIEFTSDCYLSISGADLCPTLSGREFRTWSVAPARAGDTLRFLNRRSGNRAYVAIDGGMAAAGPPTADEFETIRLQKGARIERAAPKVGFSPVTRAIVSRSIRPAYSRCPTVRVIPCSEFDLLTPPAKSGFDTSVFALTVDSNRMGFRLSGPAFEAVRSNEMVSAAVTFGTIQLLPNGQFVILMADHQTSGGYPRIATVISADLPLLGQLGPGDRVSFRLTDIYEAEKVAAERERHLALLRTSLAYGRYW